MTTDAIVTKLRDRFADGLSSNAGENFGDLWSEYSAAENGGDYFAGQALYDHYGGPEDNFADRADRFWSDFDPGDTGWEKFTEDQISGAGDNTVTLGEDGGVWTLTGVGGDGSDDRRVYLLDGSSVTDCEVQVDFDSESGTAGQGQAGVALRATADDEAVIVWENIVFGAKSNLIRGVWEWNATGDAFDSLNQISGDVALYGPDVISAEGDGSTVTVTTALPHLLQVGEVIHFDGSIGTLGQVNVASIVDRVTFTVSDSWTGSDDSGNFRWVLAPAHGLRRMAVRLVGDQLTYKQWLVDGQLEPDWDDSLRVGTVTLPDPLDGGGPPPSSGQVGLLGNHLGDGAEVLYKRLVITDLS